jgi:hypothetical protein
MRDLINFVNNRLKHHHLSLNDSDVLNNYRLVRNAWEENLININNPIKFIIIGESTVNFDNYFYNPLARTTSFLNPAHFGLNSKMDLINFFNENGVLVFDLYPLPLPTFLYDNIRFDRNNIEYINCLSKYYDVLKDLVTNETKFVLRYSKLLATSPNQNGNQPQMMRIETEVFMNCFNLNREDFLPINSQNMSASQEKIAIAFANILP